MTIEQVLPVNTILQGDSLTRLKELPNDCIDCVITSPPYWALRDYKVEGQLGLEPTFNEYLEKLLAIFDEIKRVLKPTGTVWVNLGDKRAGSGGAGGDYNKGGLKEGQPKYPRIKHQKIKHGWIGIPHKFSDAMQERDWILCDEMIWWKRNCMPSSRKRGFTRDFENIFMFAKSWDYYFETQYEPYQPDSLRISKAGTGEGKHAAGVSAGFGPEATAAYKEKLRQYPKFGGNKAAGHGNPTYSGNEWEPATFGRLKRCVWDITTQGFEDAHFATFPEELVENCIKPGCPEWVCKKCGKPREVMWEPSEEYKKLLGSSWVDHDLDDEQGLHQRGKKMAGGIKSDYHKIGSTDCGCNAGFAGGICLDPFMGSGTVGLVAMKLARNFIGIELNSEYIVMAMKRLDPYLKQERLF